MKNWASAQHATDSQKSPSANENDMRGGGTGSIERNIRKVTFGGAGVNGE
jgi:hypothetical protein